MNRLKRTLYFETITDGSPDFVFASTFHKATKKEIANAKRLHEKGECPHTIFYDVPGYMYDHRMCATCGKSKGVI